MKQFHLNMSTIWAFSLLVSSFFISISGNGQTKHSSNGNVNIVIEGTSNLHDWDMKSDKGTCSGVFDINSAGAITGISSLSFSVPAKSLKSEHSGMDKNTYKALNTDKYATINFVAGSASVKANGSTYTITAKGKLTISGTTKDVIIVATGIVNPDKSITYSGSYKLKMTEYKVEPPTAVFGTIKTGDELVVKFNMVLKTI